MKVFQEREVFLAYQHAAQGGQALHLHGFIMGAAPDSFRRDVERGKQIAHLLDQDMERLVTTARLLGVRWIVVEHQGTRRQHIDLCGEPLANALALAGGGGDGSAPQAG